MSPAKHSGTYGSLCPVSVCPSVCLSVCLSGSHTFLVVKHSYVSQATHAFLGMLPLSLILTKLFRVHSNLPLTDNERKIIKICFIERRPYGNVSMFHQFEAYLMYLSVSGSTCTILQFTPLVSSCFYVKDSAVF